MNNNILPISRLLKPQSIAIVGASDKKGALGNSVLQNLRRNNYDGKIHLINPKRNEIDGIPCLQSISDLPNSVDVAILAIPRVAVLESLRELARRKVGAAIIFSAGFAEGGAEGIKEQEEIGKIAAQNAMIIEGPNCLGSVNYIDAIPLTFVETKINKLNGRKGIGIVSQSGAMACVLGVTIASRNLGLSYSVSTGNEAASGVEDYVEYLIEDDNTNVITMIVEQFRKPKRFLDAAKKAREIGKQIILLHPGKSAAARESAATHTGAMAGDYKLMRAKVEAEGVIIAETLEEIADIAEIAIRCPSLPYGGSVVFGESGAFKALTLDLCEEIGIDLPVINDKNAPALRDVLPEFVGISNPLDLTAQGLVEPDLYYRTLEAVFNDERFGTVVLGIIQTDPVTCGIKIPPILKAMTELKPTKPVIFAGLDEGANIPQEFIEQLRDAGIPYFPSTERVLRAIKRINLFTARNFKVVSIKSEKSVDLSGFEQTIPEYKSKELLAKYGISFPEGMFAENIETAVVHASRIGYPVVIKAQSADLSHKSDAGGVILNIKNEEELRKAFEKIYTNVASYDSSIKLDGILIEKMGKMGLELIIGGKNDPEWGGVILVGFGGIAAELFKDVILLPPNLPKDLIIEAINTLKSAPLLNGYRGSPALDVEAVADLITKMGQFMHNNPEIAEFDLNPVIVREKGEGVLPLDALMQRK